MLGIVIEEELKPGFSCSFIQIATTGNNFIANSSYYTYMVVAECPQHHLCADL